MDDLDATRAQTRDEAVSEADRLYGDISNILKGRGPDVQGAVLVQLLARYFAAHADFVREDAKRLLLDSVDLMVPVMEHIMFSNGGHPGNIGEPTHASPIQ